VSERVDPVPVLDLAPKRKRPLVLWNPLDYMTLFYWAFFFPQALRWYIEHFGDPRFRDVEGHPKFWEAVRNDRIQRSLIVQGVVTLFLFDLAIVLILQVCGLQISWAGVAFGVTGGVLGGVAFGIAGGVAFGVAGGIAVGTALSVALGVALGVAGGIVFGVVAGVAVGIIGGVAFGVFGGVAISVAVSVAACVAVVVGVCVPAGAAIGVAACVAFATSVLISISRFLDWVLSLPASLLWAHPLPSRMVWLPLPGVRRKLGHWLDRDWVLGVKNTNQILAFSLQFISVVMAVNEVLARSRPGDLLWRLAVLAEGPYDWKLLRFGSASLRNEFLLEAVESLVLIPSRWRWSWRMKYPADLRFDTPARSACAGFWLWHSREARRAVEAFANVREIPFGAELHGISQAIASGSEIGSLDALARWKNEVSWMENLAEERLRPATLATLEILREISEDASVAHHASAPLNRSAALGRAAAELDRLTSTAEEICPYPEWPLIRNIASSWLKIVVAAAGAAGEEVLREPVLNPYVGYSGLPVTGTTFIGRLDVFNTIETLWVSGEILPVVFLYGHRRMGKTSILRNLEHAAPRGTLLVYLDMQDSTFVDHTGELLLDLAEGLHRRTVEAGLDAVPPPDEARYKQLGDARRELNALFTRLDSQMEGRRLILAIDEFERIEKAIADGRVDAGVLDYLRALNQRHRWLALVFGGLHTLDEMGRDYKNAFYGQAEHVRVGYLSREDTERLVTQPHPDFALEYVPQLRDELYQLTFGQPYLLQRICWEMVNRWNERFLKEGEKTQRTLTLADLEPVLDHDLYAGAAYYFDGVWSNVTEEERRTMATMAGREEPWAIPDLAAALGVAVEEVGRIMALLKRHDVIVEEPGGIRFASELMRRWVVRSGLSK
jgi:AAA ATPase domain